MKDDLGDRMKMYEGMEAGRRLMPLLPALARIDGRAFHSFTRGMTRPFDAAFSVCMVDTTSALVRDTGACMGYTQSDEITLAWHSRTTQSQIWFDGRVAKMTSQLAAQATRDLALCNHAKAHAMSRTQMLDGAHPSGAKFTRWAVDNVQEHEVIVPGDPEAPKEGV